MLKRSYVEYCHPAQAGENRVMTGPRGLVGITLYIRKTIDLKSSEATVALIVQHIKASLF